MVQSIWNSISHVLLDLDCYTRILRPLRYGNPIGDSVRKMGSTSKQDDPPRNSTLNFRANENFVQGLTGTL